MRLNNTATSISVLGYAGLIPFAVACVLAVIGLDGLASKLFFSYSAIILSFLGGALWGRIISCEQPQSTAVISALIASNVFALLGFAALLLISLGPILPLVFLTAGFVAILIAEQALSRVLAPVPPEMHPRYAGLRAVLSVGVLLLHGVFYFLV